MVNDGDNANRKALQLFKNYNQPVIAQKFMEGYEVELPVLINRQFRIVLPPVGIGMAENKYFTKEFFDYDAIFYDDYLPYDFQEVENDMAQNMMLNAYKIIEQLNLDGYMRLDFRVDAQGKCFVFDINNDPSINSCGSFLKSIEILGFNAGELPGILIGNTLI
jgi:D-alanine-D-alanine ligase-like ATP-grasp enzyme